MLVNRHLARKTVAGKPQWSLSATGEHGSLITCNSAASSLRDAARALVRRQGSLNRNTARSAFHRSYGRTAVRRAWTPDNTSASGFAGCAGTYFDAGPCRWPVTVVAMKRTTTCSPSAAAIRRSTEMECPQYVASSSRPMADCDESMSFARARWLRPCGSRSAWTSSASRAASVAVARRSSGEEVQDTEVDVAHFHAELVTTVTEQRRGWTTQI